MRTKKEVLKAEEEFFNKIWYDRHKMLEAKGKMPKEAIRSAKNIEKKYNKKELGPHTDMDWGMLNGKLSALRWILGGNWDDLDT